MPYPKFPRYPAKECVAFPLRMAAAVLLTQLALSGIVSAQSTAAPETSDDSLKPTMPEIVVRPESRATGPAEPVDTAQPEAPGDPYDLPLSYPSLSQMEFQGIDSALRGTRSLFDSPRATSIITAEDLAQRQPSTMIEAIQREVGVLVQQTGAGQASPFIRSLLCSRSTPNANRWCIVAAAISKSPPNSPCVCKLTAIPADSCPPT